MTVCYIFAKKILASEHILLMVQYGHIFKNSKLEKARNLLNTVFQGRGHWGHHLSSTHLGRHRFTLILPLVLTGGSFSLSLMGGGRFWIYPYHFLCEINSKVIWIYWKRSNSVTQGFGSEWILISINFPDPDLLLLTFGIKVVEIDVMILYYNQRLLSFRSDLIIFWKPVPDQKKIRKLDPDTPKTAGSGSVTLPYNLGWRHSGYARRYHSKSGSDRK